MISPLVVGKKHTIHTIGDMSDLNSDNVRDDDIVVFVEPLNLQLLLLLLGSESRKDFDDLFDVHDFS
jgi:hypothetical protein